LQAAVERELGERDSQTEEHQHETWSFRAPQAMPEGTNKNSVGEDHATPGGAVQSQHAHGARARTTRETPGDHHEEEKGHRQGSVAESSYALGFEALSHVHACSR